MALLVSFTPLPSLSSTLVITSSPVSRLHFKAIYFRPKSSSRVNKILPLIVTKRDAVIVKASSVDDEAASPEGGEVVSIENLPLESKEQERLEQKQRMKLAKKIRLRRKRLVRKRIMRKKGRWPPSKMKKLKNV
ncbi:50S ribosomal protein 5 alpha, chloroplastic-like [Mangifera indica]|uniref:50S ribosomal protein 5 alpha, chloroplastic-like n=1 Tax=Mangifera indica TaxID=29780 RepID=UPI001CF9FC3A|nr:50S ribosomal protein 5 alpha, chloroplastic-like [Mangifera indica]XP_044467701.1 50S ribosomal protein 5 alpha, chloroplastic-like [Mangifera indica]